MSQQSDWQRFVERRRRELRDAYPCAVLTARRCCPKHHAAICDMCIACHNELFEQLATEYVNHRKDITMVNEDDRPPVNVFPEPEPVHVLGQLELFGADAREHELERKVEEAVDDAA